MGEADPFERLVRAPRTARRRGRRRRAGRRRRSRARWRARPGRTAGTRSRSARARSRDSSRSSSRAASTPPIRTTPLVGRSSVPMTCRSVDLPDPEGPTIATSSPRRTEKDTPRSARHRRLLTVDLGHPVQFQNRFAAHGDGTTTSSPSRTSPSTCDPPAGGVEQAELHGDQLASPAGAHDLDREPAAGLPDERGDRDAQGALHALGRDLHLDRGPVEPARPLRLVQADVGRDGAASFPAGTLPSRATFPVTDVLPGKVIRARSPFFTSPCCDASRFTCTSSVSDVACATCAPGRADPPSSPVTFEMRTGSGRKTASSMSSPVVRA